MFFVDEVLDTIVQHTTLYAQRDKVCHAFQTDVDEIPTFIAILLISGYNYVLKRTIYWEQLSDAHNGTISGAMSRNMFDKVMCYLHLYDNLNMDTSGRFAKLRPLFTLLIERCLVFYPLEPYVSIDKTMVHYFGRHPSKQFVRNKPCDLFTSCGTRLQLEVM